MTCFGATRSSRSSAIRSIEDDDLASQPTLSRFEHAIDTGSFFRLRDVFIEQFTASFEEPPSHLTWDIDPFDDPTHGQQQWSIKPPPGPAPRWVVVKCEAHAQGTHRRAVVTHRPGARTLPQDAYEQYAERGESENRNKELQGELSTDRLSDPRYLANCFRMFLHCLASNLLVLLRQSMATPPACPVAAPADSPAPDPFIPEQLPPEARTGGTRRRDWNRRRAADPLGEGHACTWRMRWITVAARIQVTARCVRVFLSGSWPFLDHFRDVGRAVLDGT